MIRTATEYSPQRYIYQLDGGGNVIGKTEITRGAPDKTDAMPFRDILELQQQAENEVKEYPDLPVIDFSKMKLYEFYPTGDPIRDKEIQLGINYKKTCFDWTNSCDYDRLTAEEDFTGMSRAEVYKAIYEKYQHCYGEDFLDAQAVDYTSPPASENNYHLTLAKFYNEIKEKCGETGLEKLRRKALYGDMSDAQIVKALSEKYSGEDGVMTLRGLYRLTTAMVRCGIGNTIRSVANKPYSDDLAAAIQGHPSSGSLILRREEYLDKPVTEDVLLYAENIANSQKNIARTNDMAALRLIREYISFTPAQTEPYKTMGEHLNGLLGNVRA